MNPHDKFRTSTRRHEGSKEHEVLPEYQILRVLRVFVLKKAVGFDRCCSQVAYVSWDDVDGGHVWKLLLDGTARPQRVTEHSGYYMHPSWSPDGDKIAFLREDGAAFRNVWTRNTGQLLWVEADSGDLHYVGSAPSDNRVSFTSEGDRSHGEEQGTPRQRHHPRRRPSATGTDLPLCRPAVPGHRTSLGAARRPARLRLKRPWSNGTTHILLEPLELILVATPPAPRPAAPPRAGGHC